VYAPLYQVFYGSLQWLFSGPYAVTIAHRVILVMAVAVLVVAVFRRLLPPGIAWLLSVWWVCLPIHYDTLYEVHLFAAALSLTAVLLALRWKGLAMRSAVLGILLGTTILVRFETIFAAIVWAAAWIAYEVWRRRHKGEDAPSPRRLAAAFAAPLAVVGVLVAVGLALWTSGSSVGARFGDTQSFVLCRQFARGYEERHPQNAGGSLKSCQHLMQEKFGSRTPSYATAFVANPSEMAAHVLWNARLAPFGLQLLLFDRISGSPGENPDFVPVITGSGIALVGSFLVLSILLAGLTVLWRERRRWWAIWLRARAWGWVALIALGCSGVAAMLLQRPRPSYLFNLGVLILAAVGVCVRVLSSRWSGTARLEAVLPLIAVLLVAGMPNRYDASYETPQAGTGRPLKEIVDRLYPYREQLRGTDVHLLAPQFADEACAYIGGPAPCVGTSLLQKVQNIGTQSSPRAVISRRHINALYIDQSVIGIPGWGRLVSSLETTGWRRLAPVSPRREQWELLRFLGRTG
jgi:hypothetical protein